MPEKDTVERRLLWLLAIIAALAVGGMLAILPYRLYERDIRYATVHAHRVASVVHAALTCPVLAGEETNAMLERFQELADLEITLAPVAKATASATGGGTSELDGTELRYASPPIVGAGGETWEAEMLFDLSPLKRDSVRLIIDLVVATALGAAAFSIAVFLLLRQSLLAPLREIEEHARALANGEDPAPLPTYQTLEVAALAKAIDSMRAGSPKKAGG